MGVLTNRRDMGAYFNAVVSCSPSQQTGGSESAVTGETIDCQGIESLSFTLGGDTTLTITETLAVATEYQDSADGSTWNTAVTITASETLVTSSAGGTETAIYKTDLKTLSLERYVRFNYTPTLSLGATDTCDLVGIALLEDGAVA